MRLTWKSRENALAERVECGWGGGGGGSENGKRTLFAFFF